MKKLLLFDLDGTLLNSAKTISARTLEALSDARKAGYAIGVSTSRSMKNSQSFLGELAPEVMIASGGAIMRMEGTTVYEKGFSAEETRSIIQTAKSVLGDGCEMTVDTADDHYANYGEKYSQLEKTWGEDIYTDFSDWKSESLKVCVRITDDRNAERIKSLLTECDCIRFSEEYWYKFTKKGVTKENAILELCRIWNLGLEDIIAFGDDLADIGMLKLCGTGVAMGNALDEVKKNADIVTGSNDEDGIAGYLESILDENGDEN